MLRGQTNAILQPDSSYRAAGWLGAVFICVATFSAYCNSFTVPFLFDDESSILNNTTIRSLRPIATVLQTPGDGATASGRPLVNLSFALNYYLGRLEPFGYHLLNLVIHILGGITLFGLLRRIIPVVSPERNPGQIPAVKRDVFYVSLTTAVIWTVHPLQTESVTYISQRAESLMGLFYLLTLYCFVRGALPSRRSQSHSSQSTGPRGYHLRLSLLPGNIWYVLSIAACALGAASKEVIVTAPVVVLLLDWFYLSETFRVAWRRHWPVYAGYLCVWVALICLVATTGSRGGTVGSNSRLGWSSYALLQISAVARYLRLSFWPQFLVFDYGHALIVSPFQFLIDSSTLLLLVTATVVGLVRRNIVGLLGAVFLLILAPSSSVIPIVTEVMAEHRMYLPLAVVALVMMLAVSRLEPYSRWFLFFAITAILAFATHQRNAAYRSRESIWRDTVEKIPTNPGAHNNLGTAYLALADYPRAIEEFTRAINIDPSFLIAEHNLGTALFRAGRFGQAAACFEAVIQRRPDFIESRRDLGITLAAEGRPIEAITQFQIYLRAHPDDHEVRSRLGRALLESGNGVEAARELENVVTASPDDVEAQAILGDALLETGHAQNAVTHYQVAARLSPMGADIRVNLGIALLLCKRPNEAIASFQAALKLQPANLNAMKNLAIALRAVGRIDEARAELEKARGLSSQSGSH